MSINRYFVISKLIDKSVNKYLTKQIINMPSEAKPSKTKENI